MRVATLCGSLHSGSTNAVVLRTISDRLAAAGVTVESIDVSIDVPAFRPEAIEQPPESVTAIRDVFRRADASVFAVPEYAGGLPGWVKNILDWMVSAAALYERPVAVVSAATMGGRHAIQQLATTLTWHGAHVVATFGIPAPLTMVRDDKLTDDEAVARLDEVADTLLGVLRGERDAAEIAAETLETLGIGQYDHTS